MEIVKSKGLVIFVLIVLALTVVNSINTKRYDIKTSHNVCISMNK